MTTIATDGKTLAADMRVCAGNTIEPWLVSKIRIKGDCVYAMAGHSQLFDVMIKWYEEGHQPRSLPQTPARAEHKISLGFWAFKEGQLFELTYDMPYPMVIGTPAVLGSGRDHALTALVLGYSPEEAVKVAAKLDPFTDSNVQVLELPLRLQILNYPQHMSIEERNGQCKSLT